MYVGDINSTFEARHCDYYYTKIQKITVDNTQIDKKIPNSSVNDNQTIPWQKKQTTVYKTVAQEG